MKAGDKQNNWLAGISDYVGSETEMEDGTTVLISSQVGQNETARWLCEPSGFILSYLRAGENRGLLFHFHSASCIILCNHAGIRIQTYWFNI
jgi:hypothetical protein